MGCLSRAIRAPDSFHLPSFPLLVNIIATSWPQNGGASLGTLSAILLSRRAERAKGLRVHCQPSLSISQAFPEVALGTQLHVTGQLRHMPPLPQSITAMRAESLQGIIPIRTEGNSRDYQASQSDK